MAAGPEHWNGVYGARSEDELTRFETTPALSLELVRAHLRPRDPVIDIGATLVCGLDLVGMGIHEKADMNTCAFQPLHGPGHGTGQGGGIAEAFGGTSSPVDQAISWGIVIDQYPSHRCFGNGTGDFYALFARSHR